MNEEAREVLKKLETLAKKESLPSIGSIKGKVIADVIQDNKPKRILEIGTLYGYSAILMGSMLLDKDSGKVITIEIDQGSANIARKNIEDAALANKIEVIVGDALEIIPNLRENGILGCYERGIL